jgi:hypothetical protein
VPGADLHDRVRVQVRQLTGRMPVRASSSTTSRSRGSVLARAAAISLAASRSPGNFGSGPGFLGMSPAMTGLRGGASGQSHSMIRPENWRTVRIRCRRVSLLITWPADRRLPASHTL